MLESYITMVRNNILRHFYVYNDGRAKEKGYEIVIQDFAGFYLFLAGEGWKLAKEINVVVPTDWRCRNGSRGVRYRINDYD